MDLSIEQVQEFLSSQPSEVVDGLANSLINENHVSAFLDSDKGKSIIQPKLDSHFSKSLDTWKHNNLQRLIDEEVNRRNPAETPEAKRLREMEERLNKADAERNRAILRSEALGLFGEKNLPTGLVDYFVGETDSDTRMRVNEFENEFFSAVERAVEDRLKRGAHTPSAPSGSHQDMKTEGLTKEDFLKMSYTERARLAQQHPALFKHLTS